MLEAEAGTAGRGRGSRAEGSRSARSPWPGRRLEPCRQEGDRPGAVRSSGRGRSGADTNPLTGAHARPPSPAARWRAQWELPLGQASPLAGQDAEPRSPGHPGKG